MKFEFEKIKNMNKRDRIIALAVCSVIFFTVLIIALVTASGSTPEESAPTAETKSTGEVTAPPPSASITPAAPVSTPARPVNRYKRPDAPSSYGEFDFSTVRPLPDILARQKFKAGILVDLTNRKVLWEKNSTVTVPIASMSKLMTIYTAFEEMGSSNGITPSTRVTASNACAAVGKVKINLKPGEKYTLHELFIYAMLPSANDAAFLIAEYFGYGDSRNFIEKMNLKAREIGMNSASFVNANGLPIYNTDRNIPPRMNVASCLDMVKLIERIYEYPLILRYTSSAQAKTRFGTIKNSNQLLAKIEGMEGMKTGYTQAAGHCLAFSCTINGRRYVGVLTGFDNRQTCFNFARRLLGWGIRN
ncbi:MAG: D-alanyl-D-alanine carboxypeptidase [Lentisphaerae bacterium]|nr:D-alanyl-D-alanine carboxypeptidase [Lentisphaerota bacterium]